MDWMKTVKAVLVAALGVLSSWLGELAVPVYMLVAVNLIDYMTGKTLGEAVGNEKSVALGIPAGKTVATLHTHPTGDNTPSPADILSGFNTKSKAEYIAAGKKLRRWTWLKTPEPEDARLIRKFDEDNRNGGVDFDLYKEFLGRLIRDGYIKMENLS